MLEQIVFSFVRWSHSSGGLVVPPYDILFQHERAIDPQAVKALYATVDWWPEREEADIARVLRADLAVGAWENTVVVGFARVVTDQHFRAFIEDVVVHPAYQQRGIGTLLLTKLLGALQHIETITVFC
jgi:ribosomal protein S18 acetylase RimI-like enzyme